MRKPILLATLSLLLVACQPTSTPIPPPTMPGPTAIPTPTLLPYWDLETQRQELGQPDGGWQTIRLEEIGIAFQVPTVYEDGACYELFVTEKRVSGVEYTLIGYGGSASRISIYTAWNDEMEALALHGTPPGDVQLMTAVEPFTLDGYSGYRYVAYSMAEPPIAYYKVAAAKVGDRLVMLTFLHMVALSHGCQAPPYSDEAVFEHMVETIEFDARQPQTNTPATPSPMPSPQPLPRLTASPGEIEHWRQIQTALAGRLQGWLPSEEVLCEWEILGRDGGEIYVWARCSGLTELGQTNPTHPTAEMPAVIHLSANGNVENVEIPGAGNLYASSIRNMFPPEIQTIIFDDLIDYARLSQHLRWRLDNPEEPPLIVLESTPGS